MQIVERYARAACKPADRRPVWKWAEDHVRVDPTSPFQGLWKSSLSPWVRDIFDTFPDNNVSDISIMCSAQSAKTQSMICLLVWALSEEPAPTMWVTSTGDEAASLMKTRLIPTIKNCGLFKDQIESDRRAVNKLEVTLHNASLIVTGSSSPSRLQSKPVRWLFLDEVRNYPEGALEMAVKRTRAYWNARRVIVSTPDTENDAVHRAFLAGDQQVWHFPCMECKEPIKMEWGDLAFDQGENVRDKDGLLDMDAVAETIAYKCPHCQHRMEDVPAVRHHIVNRGRFHAMNPNAPAHRKSFHWNALLPTWVTWRDLVEEWIEAQSALRNADVQPLKDFINETLGEPWQDRLGQVEDDIDILKRQEDYDMADKWEEEEFRFLAADKQAKGGEHYYYVVRSFAKDGGHSRLVGYGRVFTETQLLEVAKDYNVHPKFCLIDCGYDTATVMKFCLNNGWKPMMGDGSKNYAHQKDGKTVRQVWTSARMDVGLGTRGRRQFLTQWRWSNPSVKDIFAELTGGLIGRWTLPADIDQDYVNQLTAEIRVERTDSKGRVAHEWKKVRKDDHLRDCELMITVASLAAGVMGSRAEPNG